MARLKRTWPWLFGVRDVVPINVVLGLETVTAVKEEVG